MDKTEKTTPFLKIVGDKPELRSVMFLAGYFGDLLEATGRPHDQLEGVLELMELANSYVLSDHTVIGGAPITVGRNEIGLYLYEHAHKSDAIELIVEREKEKILIDDGYIGWNILAFEDEVRMKTLEGLCDGTWRASKDKSYGGLSLEEAQAAIEEARDKAFDMANTLRAKSYIFLSDALGASYIPDRRFGEKAIKEYQQAINEAVHLQIHTEFRQKIADQIGQISKDNSIVSLVPSFFLEALHNAQNWKGVFASLEDIRNSKAAQHYRKLIHAYRSEDPKQRREARIELERASNAAFTKEGFSGFINRGYLSMVAFSTPALAKLFPRYAAEICVAGGAVALAEQIGVWVKNRNNIFEIYNKTEGWDLFDELARVFPYIKFKREHLDYFLSEKDFGWSNDLVRSLYNIKKKNRKPPTD